MKYTLCFLLLILDTTGAHGAVCVFRDGARAAVQIVDSTELRSHAMCDVTVIDRSGKRQTVAKRNLRWIILPGDTIIYQEPVQLDTAEGMVILRYNRLKSKENVLAAAQLLESKKPLGQTVCGISFLTATLVLEGIGIAQLIKANEYSNPSLGNGIYGTIGVMSMIGGAMTFIPGVIFAFRAKINWDEYDAVKLKLRVSGDLQGKSLGVTVSAAF